MIAHHEVVVLVPASPREGRGAWLWQSIAPPGHQRVAALYGFQHGVHATPVTDGEDVVRRRCSDLDQGPLHTVVVHCLLGRLAPNVLRFCRAVPRSLREEAHVAWRIGAVARRRATLLGQVAFRRCAPVELLEVVQGGILWRHVPILPHVEAHLVQEILCLLRTRVRLREGPLHLGSALLVLRRLKGGAVVRRVLRLVRVVGDEGILTGFLLQAFEIDLERREGTYGRC
mmetsp:Transcript_42403/g.101101  ORF Transcript_42403/g.101101 Transcript_42403/m.101101 type:complete len:229 (-) Transcript_42403:143-829(-)